MLRSICFLTLFTILFASCLRDKKDTSLEDCDIVVAYNPNVGNNVSGVKSIIDTKCANSGCHDGTFRPNMQSYSDELRSAINTDQIKEQIFDEAAMPPAGVTQLTDDELQLFNCWITGGHLEEG